MREVYLLLTGFESLEFNGHVAEQAIMNEFVESGRHYVNLYNLFDPCVHKLLQAYLNDIVQYEQENIPLLSLNLKMQKWFKLLKVIDECWDNNPFTRLHLIHLQNNKLLDQVKQYTISKVLIDIQKYLKGSQQLNMTKLPYFLDQSSLEKIYSIRKFKKCDIVLLESTINHQIEELYTLSSKELEKNDFYTTFLSFKDQFYYCNNSYVLHDFIEHQKPQVLSNYFNSHFLSKCNCRYIDNLLLMDLVWPIDVFVTLNDIKNYAVIQRTMQLLYKMNIELSRRHIAIRHHKSAKAHYFVAKHAIQTLSQSLYLYNKDSITVDDVSQFFLTIQHLCDSILLFLVAIDYSLVPTEDVLVNAKRLLGNHNELLLQRQAEMTKCINESYQLFVKENQVDLVRQSLIQYDFNQFFLMSQ